MKTPSDIVGKKFGFLTALRPTQQRRERSIVWECVCDCGNRTLASVNQLRKRGRTSCGCRRSSARPKVQARCESCGAIYQNPAWGPGSRYCVSCRQKERNIYLRSWKRTEGAKKNRAVRRARHIAAGLCPNCGTRPARISGQYCLTCAETNAISRIKYRYGLTRERLRAQLDKQDHRCAICRDELTAPHIDHHHGDGSFRGLLCSNCNGAIGLLKDNPTIIRRAAEYVQWNGYYEPDSHDLEVAA